MKTSIATLKGRKKADILLLPFWEGKKEAEPAFKIRALESAAEPPIKAGDFKGRQGETQLVYAPRFPEKRVLLLGLGKEKELSHETLRQSYACATKVCRRKKCKTVNLLLPASPIAAQLAARSIAEGMLLTNYSFDRFKKAEDDKAAYIENLAFVGADKSCLDQIQKAQKIIHAVNFTRDLVNGNADDVNAQTLSQVAKDLAKEFSAVTTKVLGEKELEKEKMGLMLAVNRGAAQEPALILIEYKGDPRSKDVTAIVGKGITFDTGGLNLKPTGGIETMKADMSGAAAVLGTIRAAASLGLKKNILGVVASCENAIGPKSYKPGDVVRSFSGKTVEIGNTDAEGRLVLADALSYLQKKYTVSRIIDLATLTGGVVVALGEEVTGLFANQDPLAKALTEAGERTYERLWRLPLYKEYKEATKSPIADMKNTGSGRKASPIMGAIFLQEFIEKEMPWAHLDIAGTAYLSELNRPYHPIHGTGVGVRLLIDYLDHL